MQLRFFLSEKLLNNAFNAHRQYFAFILFPTEQIFEHFKVFCLESL